jgi:hypothetical protein
MNEIKPKTTGVAVPDTYDPFLEFANEGGGQTGKLIKYTKGKYFQGDKEIALGTEYHAIVYETARGWVLFQDGRLVEHRLGLIRNAGARFAPREALGLMDKPRWERDRKGEPKDPWQKQYYLPLVHLESQELFCFVTNSEGGIGAIRDLSRQYSPYRATTMIPVVSLQTDTYEHPDYGTVHIPILRIERWDDAGVMPPAPAPAPAPPSVSAPAPQLKPDPITSGKAGKNRNDMDDDIPFERRAGEHWLSRPPYRDER